MHNVEEEQVVYQEYPQKHCKLPTASLYQPHEVPPEIAQENRIRKCDEKNSIKETNNTGVRARVGKNQGLQKIIDKNFFTSIL